MKISLLNTKEAQNVLRLFLFSVWGIRNLIQLQLQCRLVCDILAE